MNQSDIVCRCLSVSRAEIQEAITVFSAETVHDVARVTEAGTGCMCCRRCIVDIIRQKQAEARAMEIA